MKIRRISEKVYVRLAGTLGGLNIRRDLDGTSWMLVDGNVVAEVAPKEGRNKRWKYVLITPAPRAETL